MTAESLRNVCLAQIKAGKSSWVTDLRDKALAKITKGGGQILVLEQGSGNGKSFGGKVLMDCVSVAETTQSALDDAAADGSETVAGANLDFRGLLCSD